MAALFKKLINISPNSSSRKLAAIYSVLKRSRSIPSDTILFWNSPTMERSENARPELTEQIENPDSYDVIFLKNQFLADMFLTTRFIFFDFERPFPLFFVEYLAIIGLFVSLAHYGTRGFQKMAE